MKKVDLKGRRFGRLVVMEAGTPVSEGRYTRTTWLCQCDCGKTKIIRGRGLIKGSTKSCGCYRSEYVAKKNHRHGMAHRNNTVPEYQTWSDMIKRCENTETAGYDHYGARGIIICSRWRESFAAFYTDMGPKPSLQHSVERKDVDGNYEPSNCKWGTKDEQANNKTSSIWMTVNGETQTAKQMWRKHGPKGLSYAGFLCRLYRGWTHQQALFAPRYSKHRCLP